jgi:hypothetical protein
MLIAIMGNTFGEVTSIA